MLPGSWRAIAESIRVAADTTVWSCSARAAVVRTRSSASLRCRSGLGDSCSRASVCLFLMTGSEKFTAAFSVAMTLELLRNSTPRHRSKGWAEEAGTVGDYSGFA